MKNIMCTLAVILLMMESFVSAPSLPNSYMTGKQQTTGENWRVARREADLSKNADPAMSKFMAEITNLSIPSYLKHLFINLTHNETAHPSVHHTRVNTIRSYENQAKNVGCGHYKFHMKKHELVGEDIVRAELRLLQKSSMILEDHYDVEISYLLGTKAHVSPLPPISFKHIDSTPGWKTFDATPIALNWKQGLVNHGLQIKLTKDGETISCEGVFSEEKDSWKTKPSLIVFTHDHSFDFLKVGVTEKASHVITQKRRRNSNTLVTPTVVQNEGCHLQDLNVTSESLSAGNIRVLYPKRFNAKICSGHCKRLDPESLQSNTIKIHADIISMHYRNIAGIQEVPSRCCKPTSFNILPMIFYDEALKERIIKVNVPAQAAKCGCL